MSHVLGQLVIPPHPDVLVGIETADDAGVYRLTPDLALVQTVDFFTPIVDDPYLFGQIAAANAVSDIYAMGAQPLTALNIVAFPIDKLPGAILVRILEGAMAKAAESGLVIIGGHTVNDPEPKFGMAVTGIVRPDRVLKNIGAEPGDVLILTKPLGSGILTTALKHDQIAEAEAAEAITWMTTLNKAASEASIAAGVHAVTDVTGFGLLGHLAEMLRGSKMGAQLSFGKIPLMRRVLDLAQAGSVPGGTKANLRHLSTFLHCAPEVSEAEQQVLADAQTSGGLLVAVPPQKVPFFLAELADRGAQGWEIGEVVAQSGIFVIP
ncbi:MAG: selenide, water dikinase SelD [Cyanobacteria bacterium NC_groundwater_1444_Ag_S-0.65um_54_12]|nr:selenide, water dikinase SelD [Cyanobacteria bacterium NC_groundwater_1444_Ag_S-0.65um_54_12]